MENRSVTIQFHGWLEQLLTRVRRKSRLLFPSLQRRTSIKDLIESVGVPHTEIGSLAVNGEKVLFHHIICEKSHVDVFPHCPPVNVLVPSALNPIPLPAIRFLVDANVSKLASKLRMAGFDTFYNSQWDDQDLADISQERKCILLTRDIQLLKRRKIVFGHFVRETIPLKQMSEVIHFYGLLDSILPFSRCMSCNGMLVPVKKQDILEQLEPLTQKYYNVFHRCSTCSQVYWFGSHREQMERDLSELRRNYSLS